MAMSVPTEHEILEEFASSGLSGHSPYGSQELRGHGASPALRRHSAFTKGNGSVTSIAKVTSSSSVSSGQGTDAEAGDSAAKRGEQSNTGSQVPSTGQLEGTDSMPCAPGNSFHEAEDAARNSVHPAYDLHSASGSGMPGGDSETQRPSDSSLAAGSSADGQTLSQKGLNTDSEGASETRTKVTPELNDSESSVAEQPAESSDIPASNHQAEGEGVAEEVRKVVEEIVSRVCTDTEHPAVTDCKCHSCVQIPKTADCTVTFGRQI